MLCLQSLFGSVLLPGGFENVACHALRICCAESLLTFGEQADRSYTISSRNSVLPCQDTHHQRCCAQAQENLSSPIRRSWAALLECSGRWRPHGRAARGPLDYRTPSGCLCFTLAILRKKKKEPRTSALLQTRAARIISQTVRHNSRSVKLSLPPVRGPSRWYPRWQRRRPPPRGRSRCALPPPSFHRSPCTRPTSANVLFSWIQPAVLPSSIGGHGTFPMETKAQSVREDFNF